MSTIAARNLPQQQRQSSWHHHPQHSHARDRQRDDSPTLPFLFSKAQQDLELDLEIQRQNSMKAQRWLGLVTEVPKPRQEEERPISQRASLEWLQPEEAPESERELSLHEVHPALRVEVSSPVSIGSVSSLGSDRRGSGPDPLRPEPLRIPSKPHSRPISISSLEPQFTASPVSLSTDFVPKPWMRAERSSSISSQQLTLSPAPLSPESSPKPWLQPQRRPSIDPQPLSSSPNPSGLSPDLIPKPWTRPHAERRVSYESRRASRDSLSPDLVPKPWSRPQRPLSFASYRTEGRPTNKLASSRGFRVSTCPNFSRPISGIAPKAIPGEQIEQDPLYERFEDDEVGPPSPDSPRVAGLGFEVERIQSREGFAMESGRCGDEHIEPEPVKEKEKGKGKEGTDGKRRPRKARWSSLPLSLMKFAKRKSTDVKDERKEPEREEPEEKQVRLDLTEDNLQRWEYEVGYLPKVYRLDLATKHEVSPARDRAPMEQEEHYIPMPLPVSTAPPQIPNLLTPPHSPGYHPHPQHAHHHHPHHKHTTSSSSSLPLSVLKELSLTPPQPPDIHPRFRPASPTPAARPVRMCTLCKESLLTVNFPVRRTTSACDHPPSTCAECLQGWIAEGVERRGVERVACPECGEVLGVEDVEALGGVVEGEGGWL